MLHSLLADLVLLIHLAFILFVVFGGLLVLRWRRLAWLHLPAVGWGIWIELSGRLCPLTPLENYFRRLAGQAGYSGGFVEQYLLPVVYPEQLTRELQVGLGAGVITVNLLIYACICCRRKK